MGARILFLTRLGPFHHMVSSRLSLRHSFHTPWSLLSARSLPPLLFVYLVQLILPAHEKHHLHEHEDGGHQEGLWERKKEGEKEVGVRGRKRCGWAEFKNVVDMARRSERGSHARKEDCLRGTGRGGRREGGREGDQGGESCLIEVGHQCRRPAFKNEVSNELGDPAQCLSRTRGEGNRI